jgi:rubrerythrin
MRRTMNQNKEEILNGLKTAIEAELTGYNFYRNAAQTMTDPQGKEAFLRLSEEEIGHFEYLRHQYKSIMEKGAYDFTKKLLKPVDKDPGNLIFSEAIKKRIKESHFEVSVLSIAMKLESDAAQFYRSCARKTQDPQARQFYRELADWEEEHFKAFEQQLNALKEDYFQANNFIPM